MNCGEVKREISQSVHSGHWPEGALAGHLRVCGECGAEWDSHQELARQLAAMRESAAAHRPSLERRARLMREFSSRYPQRRPVVQQAVVQKSWKWALAAAAAVVLAAGGGVRALDWWTAQQKNMELAALEAAESDGQEDFIAVPYAPALASGEVLRVVRTELYPAALASLGVDLDPSLTGKMPADLLVGEDGYPRAVRVSADMENNF